MRHIKLSSNIKETEVHKSQGFFLKWFHPYLFSFQTQCAGWGAEIDWTDSSDKIPSKWQIFMSKLHAEPHHSSGVLSIQIHNMSPASQNVYVSQVWEKNFWYSCTMKFSYQSQKFICNMAYSSFSSE